MENVLFCMEQIPAHAMCNSWRLSQNIDSSSLSFTYSIPVGIKSGLATKYLLCLCFIFPYWLLSSIRAGIIVYILSFSSGSRIQLVAKWLLNKYLLNKHIEWRWRHRYKDNHLNQSVYLIQEAIGSHRWHLRKGIKHYSGQRILVVICRILSSWK